VVCQICQKSFTRQSVLNVHSQMVHGTPSKISAADSNVPPMKTGERYFIFEASKSHLITLIWEKSCSAIDRLDLKSSFYLLY
jgi:hypothetical protein